MSKINYLVLLTGLTIQATVTVRAGWTLLRGKAAHKGTTIVGLFLSCFIFTLIGVIIYLCTHIFPDIIKRKTYRDMSNLAFIAELYTKNHAGCLPERDKWCDAINQNGFLQVAVDKQNYMAMNTHVSGKKLSDLSEDTVLFFETSKAGWNQYGTEQALNCEQYLWPVKIVLPFASSSFLRKFPHAGGFVVFADGKVRFIQASDIEKTRFQAD